VIGSPLNRSDGTSVIDSFLFDFISVNIACDALIEDNVGIAHINNCKTYYQMYIVIIYLSWTILKWTDTSS